MVLDTLKWLLPQGLIQHIPRSIRDRIRGRDRALSLSAYRYLEGLMRNYQLNHLVNVDPVSFKQRIDSFLEMEDHVSEGYRDPGKQRDLSIRFHWGHNHNFGDFSLQGRMGNRHIELLARFIDQFGAISRDLNGLKVLDIGCWTGGTSLLLSAMGAEVVAIEEVRKYAECVNSLKEAFKMDRLTVRNLSLYECTTEEFQDQFDVVLFAGVLYHVTDPVLALRITFNALKDGGVCLLETAAVASARQVLTYEGPTAFTEGEAENKSRGGWNWFVPSINSLIHMMADVGYQEIQNSRLAGGRVYAVARRIHHEDMLRAGLSVRNVR